MTPRLAPSLYYRISWQLELVLAGALVVASGVARPAIVIPYFLIAFLLVTPQASRVKRHRRLITLTVLGVILVSTTDQLMNLRGVESVVSLLIELIVGALPLLLLGENERRSYWLATLNIAIVAVSSITLTAGALIYAGFILFMVLMLFNLNAAHLALPDESGRRLTEALPVSYFHQFFYVLPIGLVAASVIFVLFPRARSLNLSFGFGVKSRTGYSGGIELLGGGEIETSQELAFLVEGPGPEWARRGETTLLFRGDSLDSFDGTRWSRSDWQFDDRRPQTDLRTSGNHANDFYTVTVYREASYVATLFYPGVVVDLLGPPSLGEVRYDRAGTLAKKNPSNAPYDYTLRVADVLPWPAGARQALSAAIKEAPEGKAVSLRELAAGEAARYLAIPDTIRQASYFKSWLGRVGVDPAKTSVAEAAATLKQHFAEHFEATLANQFSGPDAFQAFLEKDHRGHCEYFATATTLFFRSLGVPARVVVGYKGGVFNKVVSLLEVREANAHAWSEVYVPKAGWLPVDLMPPSQEALVSDSDFRQIVNAVSYLFRQYVVDYNFEAQRGLFQSLADMTRREQRADEAWRDWVTRHRTPLGVVALGGILGAAVFFRRRLTREKPKLPLYYVRFQKDMARRGKVRTPGETYARFHLRLISEGIPAAVVEPVDRNLERDLYEPLQESGEFVKMG